MDLYRLTFFHFVKKVFILEFSLDVLILDGDFVFLAGLQGGGGILKVNSSEELDEVMGSFPFLAVYDVEILPITDLSESLKRSKKVLEARI